MIKRKKIKINSDNKKLIFDFTIGNLLFNFFIYKANKILINKYSISYNFFKFRT